MRVVLSQFEGIDNTPGLPLAAGCLVASARMDARLASAQFAIQVERRAIEPAVAAYEQPDVLGFSLYPWNAVYSLEVAQAARAAFPDALIVAGGPAVPRRPGSARRLLDAHAALDVLVFAEGELSFRELLVAHVQRRDFGTIGGIAFRRGGEVVFTEPPARVKDFGETASPYLDGTFDELFATVGRGRFAMAMLETNRGCPFTCSFCDWSLTRHVVEFPVERVHAELDWVTKNGFGHVCICDANFGIRPRDHDIARRIAALKRETGGPTYVYFYLTKNNHGRNLGTIEILHEAGIGCCVGLAVQDFDDDVLTAVKRDNIQSGESILLRDICAERGIPTHNELIFGLPRQTFESFSRTVVQAMPPYPQHNFVVFQCRLLDNTDMASPESREEFGIETRRCLWTSARAGWDPVVDEYQELVVGTKDMPVEDWRRTYRFVYLAAAAYNLRLLRVVLQYLGEALEVDLVDYLTFLGDAIRSSPPGGVFAAVDRVFDSFLDSILGSGPFALPLPLTGEAPLEIADAVAVTALERSAEFFAEALEHTRRFLEGRAADPAAIDELFRYQDLITPRHGCPDIVDVELSYDWPAYAAGGRAVPAERQLRARFVPPHYATSPEFGLFATTHLACMQARMSTGEVVEEEEAPRRSAPQPDPIDGFALTVS